MKSRNAVALAVIAVVATMGAVGTGAAGTRAATSPPTSDPPVTEVAAPEVAAGSTLPATETVAADTDWEKVVPGGDCACADGSEFNFWVREADPAKVVLYLEGGGACFDPTTCAFEDSSPYDWNISPDDDPSLMSGIFDFANPQNPFADYSFVHVPYCTGDVHLGDRTREYAPDLTVEHVGMVNGTAALSYLAENFADAAQVVVVGRSAGAVASPLYGGLVSDVVPDAQVTVYADGAGAYPDEPGINTVVGELWGTFANVPDWDVNEGLAAEDWGAAQLWVQAGLHDPEIVMSRFDHAYDEVQTSFMDLLGLDTSDVGASMAAREAEIEAAGVVQHSFTAPGTEHTLVRDDPFYAMEVNGIVLSEWVGDVVAGDDVADVVCTECGDPAPPTTG
ncbi:MAG TPA: pectin acetylesterase-family hydrolase [Desertimonas sp.]|nr:pectin acetylesterase-family hydrolase [Desertimonas sp.]